MFRITTSRVKCPCGQECADRSPECRKTCGKYKQYEAAKSAERAQTERSRRGTVDARLYQIEKAERLKKRAKRKTGKELRGGDE